MSGSDDRQRRFWIGDSEAAPEPSSGPAASSGQRRLRVAEWVVLAAGLALFGVLLARLGVASVFANVRAVGWGIALIIAVEILAYGANTLGWRAVFPRGGGAPPLRRLLGARIAGDAANYLTPTASLGGEFVRVRMLGGQAPTASIVASVMVAKLTQTVGLVAFLAGGFLAVVDGTRLPPSARWGLLAGMIAFATVLGALLIAQRRGLLVPALRLATRWRALRFLAPLERPLEQIDAEMARVHAESTGRVVLSAASFALGFACGIVESYLILWFLGIPVTLELALAVEVLGVAFNNLLFFVPLRAGTQEAGKALVFAVLGLDPCSGVGGGADLPHP